MGIEVEPTELLDFMEEALEERKGSRDRRDEAHKSEAKKAESDRRSGSDRRKQHS